MKNKFVDSVTNFITKRKNCTEKEIKTIRYGLEGLYLSFSKLFIVAIITLILNTFIEFIILLISYNLIRKYSFGLHASKSWICWITTLPIYVGGSLLIKYVTLNINIVYIIWILTFISFLLWAPADTPKRPLIRAKQRTVQKIKTCIISIGFLIIIIFINNNTLINALTLSSIIQAIIINPLVYWITKTPFNNYKSYPNKV